MTHPIAPHIKDLLTAIDVAIKEPAADKQRLRRARSALETAFYVLGGTMDESRPNGQQAGSQSAGINVSSPASGYPNPRCSCLPGTRLANCDRNHSLL